jgi:hypothetical protein
MITRVARLLLPAFALLAALASGLHAQRTVAVALGSRMRVQTQNDSTWRVGRLAGIVPDTIRLRSCDSCADDVYSLSSLSTIQVSVGRTRRGTTIFKGAVLGTLAGLGSGWLYGWAKTRHCAPNDDLCGLEYLAVPFFGAGGLFIGMAIGSSRQYDDWRPALIR